MSVPEQDPPTLPALRALMRAEAAALCASLPPRAGRFGLRLDRHADADPPACPDAVAQWVRLHLANDHWCGDLLANGHEALPFADDAFAIVWVHHALQARVQVRALLREAARVTEPGGLLVLGGVHPLSIWSPWLAWHQRAATHREHLHLPAELVRTLGGMGLRMEKLLRYGSFLPRCTQGDAPNAFLGGGYLLVARKHADAVIPLRPMRMRAAPPLHAGFAPHAHRDCA